MAGKTLTSWWWQKRPFLGLLAGWSSVGAALVVCFAVLR
jgi:hypothetical protein